MSDRQTRDAEAIRDRRALERELSARKASVAEPTVPVPVSLIERFLSLAERADEAWANNIARDFRALLSQPEPTAGLNSTEAIAGFESYERLRQKRANRAADLLSIERMAPGTTFTARTHDGQVSRWRRLRSGDVESGEGVVRRSIVIDPSTIRDVTSPRTTAVRDGEQKWSAGEGEQTP